MHLSSALSSLDVVSTKFNSLNLFSDCTWQSTVSSISTSSQAISCSYSLSSSVHFGYSEGGSPLLRIPFYHMKLVLLSQSSSLGTPYHKISFLRLGTQRSGGMSIARMTFPSSNFRAFNHSFFTFVNASNSSFFLGNSMTLKMSTPMMSRHQCERKLHHGLAFAKAMACFSESLTMMGFLTTFLGKTQKLDPSWPCLES